MNDIIDLLVCPSIIPHMIGLAMSWCLSKNYYYLESILRVEEVYGFISLNTYIDDTRYLLLTTFKVDGKGYKLYEIRETNNWIVFSNKVVVLRYDDLDKYLKKLGVKIFLKKKKDLFKKIVWCIGRRKRTCLVTNDELLVFGTTYLNLSINCREYSLTMNALELFDSIIDSIRKPLHSLVDMLSSKEKLDREMKEKIMDGIDEYILLFISDLVMRNRLVIPDIKTVNDLVNYVKSHFKR